MTANPNPTRESSSRALDPALVATLKLQEVDVARMHLETQLKQAPIEVASLARTAAEEKAAIEAKRKGVQDLEVQRKDIDNRLKLAEAQVNKFKNQQLEVKKNDEYQALTHQIATCEAGISDIETEELQQMIKIDEANAVLRLAETEYKRRMADLDGQMAHLKQKEAQCQANLQAQIGNVEAAAAPVPPVWRKGYDTAKSRAKRAPFVVPIDDHRCGGCHLRVSNDVSEAARHGGKPVQCDSCGRLIYWPA